MLSGFFGETPEQQRAEQLAMIRASAAGQGRMMQLDATFLKHPGGYKAGRDAWIAAGRPGWIQTPEQLRRAVEQGVAPSIPIAPDIFTKVSALTPTQKERVLGRIQERLSGRKRKVHSKRMTPKKFRKVVGRHRPTLRGMGEAPVNRADIATMIANTPAVEIYDRDPFPGGFPGGSTRAIVKQVDFLPRAGAKLVDIPVDLTEQVKEELVEGHGVADADAQMLASNAVDRWLEKRVERTPMTAVEARVVSGSFVPQFSIESLPGMSGLTPEAADGIVQKYAAAGIDWKSLIPLAIGAGILILWLKNR